MFSLDLDSYDFPDRRRGRAVYSVADSQLKKINSTERNETEEQKTEAIDSAKYITIRRATSN